LPLSTDPQRRGIATLLGQGFDDLSVAQYWHESIWVYLVVGLLAWSVGAVLVGFTLGAVIRRRDLRVERPKSPDRPTRLIRYGQTIGSVIRRRDGQLRRGDTVDRAQELGPPDREAEPVGCQKSGSRSDLAMWSLRSN
jgi:hypothetical protein